MKRIISILCVLGLASCLLGTYAFTAAAQSDKTVACDGTWSGEQGSSPNGAPVNNGDSMGNYFPGSVVIVPGVDLGEQGYAAIQLTAKHVNVDSSQVIDVYIDDPDQAGRRLPIASVTLGPPDGGSAHPSETANLFFRATGVQTLYFVSKTSNANWIDFYDFTLSGAYEEKTAYAFDSTWSGENGPVAQGDHMGNFFPNGVVKVPNVQFGSSGFGEILLNCKHVNVSSDQVVNVYADDPANAGQRILAAVVKLGPADGGAAHDSPKARFFIPLTGLQTLYFESDANNQNWIDFYRFNLSGAYEEKTAYLCDETWSGEGGPYAQGDPLHMGNFFANSTVVVPNVYFGTRGFATIAVQHMAGMPSGVLHVYVKVNGQKVPVAAVNVVGDGTVRASDPAAFSTRLTGLQTLYVESDAANSAWIDLYGLMFDGVYAGSEETARYPYDAATWTREAGDIADAGDHVGGYDPGDMVKVTGVQFGAGGFGAIQIEYATPHESAPKVAVYADDPDKAGSKILVALTDLDMGTDWSTKLTGRPAAFLRRLTGTQTLYFQNVSDPATVNMDFYSFTLAGEYDDTAPADPDYAGEEIACDAAWMAIQKRAVIGEHVGGYDSGFVVKTAEVNFGSKGFGAVRVKAAHPHDANQVVGVYVNDLDNPGSYLRIATVKLKAGAGWESAEYSDDAALAQKITGVHSLYLKNEGAGNLDLYAVTLSGVYEEEVEETTVYPYDSATWTRAAGEIEGAGDHVGSYDPADMVKVSGVQFGADGYGNIKFDYASPHDSAPKLAVYADDPDKTGAKMLVALVDLQMGTDWATRLTSRPAAFMRRLTGAQDLYIENVSSPASVNIDLYGFSLEGAYDGAQTADPAYTGVTIDCSGEWMAIQKRPTIAGHVGAYDPGVMIKVPDVNFGSKGFDTISLTFCAPHDTAPKVAVFTDDLDHPGQYIRVATLDLTMGTDWSTKLTSRAEKLGVKLTGKRHLYLMNISTSDLQPIVNLDLYAVKLAGEYAAAPAPGEPDYAAGTAIACEDSWQAIQKRLIIGDGHVGNYDPYGMVKIPNVNFGSEGFDTIRINAAHVHAANPIVGVYVDDPDSLGNYIRVAKVTLGEGAGWNHVEYSDEAYLTRKVTGVQHVYLKNEGGVNLDIYGVMLKGAYSGSHEGDDEEEEEPQGTLKIDGVLDDAYTFDSASSLALVNTAEVPNTQNGTLSVWRAHDANYVYFYIKVTADAVGASDYVEVWLDPDPSNNAGSMADSCVMSVYDDLCPQFYPNNSGQPVLVYADASKTNWFLGGDSKSHFVVSSNEQGTEYTVEFLYPRTKNETSFGYTIGANFFSEDGEKYVVSHANNWWGYPGMKFIQFDDVDDGSEPEEGEQYLISADKDILIYGKVVAVHRPMTVKDFLEKVSAAPGYTMALRDKEGKAITDTGAAVDAIDTILIQRDGKTVHTYGLMLAVDEKLDEGGEPGPEPGQDASEPDDGPSTGVAYTILGFVPVLVSAAVLFIFRRRKA